MKEVHCKGTALRSSLIDEVYFPWSSKVNPIQVGDLVRVRSDAWQRQKQQAQILQQQQERAEKQQQRAEERQRQREERESNRAERRSDSRGNEQRENKPIALRPKAKARLSGRGPRSPRARKRAAPSPGGKRRLGRGRPRSPGQPPPARERSQEQSLSPDNKITVPPARQGNRRLRSRSGDRPLRRRSLSLRRRPPSGPGPMRRSVSPRRRGKRRKRESTYRLSEKERLDWNSRSLVPLFAFFPSSWTFSLGGQALHDRAVEAAGISPGKAELTRKLVPRTANPDTIKRVGNMAEVHRLGRMVCGCLSSLNLNPARRTSTQGSMQSRTAQKWLIETRKCGPVNGLLYSRLNLDTWSMASDVPADDEAQDGCAKRVKVPTRPSQPKARRNSRRDVFNRLAQDQNPPWQVGDRVLVPDVFSFTSAITACGSSSQWLLALAVFSGMTRASTSPNVFSFNAVMSSCERPGQWERALELFAEMPAAMVEADSISFNIGISAAETGSQWKLALQLLAEMKARRLLPDVISYSAAVSACASDGRWQMALYLVWEMAQAAAVPNEITYNSAISSCEASGEWQLALQLFSGLPGSC
ncbi:Pentatricopeptide repeat-containing protein, chloroplastic [Symbiodinium microadriaticum]|uniref:Pentatricopeptide repeat-containing protein, chloroplastic n=1 Tax=Symbiodinium microadriaticum TaxID=2951 RepID=A0A1Q9ER18_SYMMI|nr:Pentatricopeptide repeat-containing protein, chloroplastic [Symbiodinium microadriaticum]